MVLLLGWFYRACDRLRYRRMRSGNQAHALGRRGEDLAHRLLQSKGYYILARNYRTPSATSEIDIVAQDRDVIVFVEVKTRSTDEYGSPDSAVDEEKRRKILLGAEHYLRRTDCAGALVRFDIVNVLFDHSQPALQHSPDAFAFESTSSGLKTTQSSSRT